GFDDFRRRRFDFVTVLRGHLGDGRLLFALVARFLFLVRFRIALLLSGALGHKAATRMRSEWFPRGNAGQAGNTMKPARGKCTTTSPARGSCRRMAMCCGDNATISPATRTLP